MARNDAKDALAVIPWYWRDWRASTARAVLISDPLAALAYRELLDAMWGEAGCSLPADDDKLAALCGLSLRAWMRVREKVLRFLPQGPDGRHSHPRSQHEYQKAVAFRESKRKGGIKTAAKRWGSNSTPVAQQPLSNRSPSPTPTPVDPQKDLQGGGGGSGLVAPPATEPVAKDPILDRTPAEQREHLARVTAERAAAVAIRAKRKPL